jgi:hypothetical protein
MGAEPLLSAGLECPGRVVGTFEIDRHAAEVEHQGIRIEAALEGVGSRSHHGAGGHEVHIDVTRFGKPKEPILVGFVQALDLVPGTRQAERILGGDFHLSLQRGPAFQGGRARRPEQSGEHDQMTQQRMHLEEHPLGIPFVDPNAEGLEGELGESGLLAEFLNHSIKHRFVHRIAADREGTLRPGG